MRDRILMRLLANAGVAVLVVALAQGTGSAQQSTQAAGRGQETSGTAASEQKAKAIVVKQDGDNVTFLMSQDGKTETKTFHATVFTKVDGLHADWKTPGPKRGASEIAGYDLLGKTAMVTYTGSAVVEMKMQTACNADYCPVKDCNKKCGAKSCVCAPNK